MTSEKSWNELLFNFREKLAKVEQNPYKDPKLIKIRKHLKEVFRTGRVYFVQRPDGLIKIGFTGNISKRVRELQLTVSLDIVVLGTVSASMNYEKRLHRIFGHYRVNGEWFYPSPLLLLYINTFAEKPKVN